MSDIDSSGNCTGDYLAVFCDVSVRRIQQLAKQGVVIRSDGGGRDRYRFMHSISNYIRFIQGSSRFIDADLKKAQKLEKESKARRAKQQADKEELEMQERLGKVVSYDWTISIWREHSENLARLAEEYISKIHREVPDMESSAHERMLLYRNELFSAIRDLRYSDEDESIDAGQSKKTAMEVSSE